MHELSQFFNMGGYAWFVWPAMLITLVVLALNVILSSRELKLAKRDAGRFAAQKATQRKAQHSGSST